MQSTTLKSRPGQVPPRWRNVPLPLVNQEVNGKKKPAPKPSHASGICVTWWRQAPFSDRVDFVRACGVSEVWDALSTAVV